MKTFKGYVLPTLCYFIIIFIISSVLIVPLFNAGVNAGSDSSVRQQLAGSIDCLISGASHGVTGIDTAIVDEKLGCFSYNLSGNMMPMSGRYHLLKKELERNPVKTVIFECSYNTFTRDEDKEYAQGDASLIPRLDSVSERFSYIKNNVKFNDTIYIYNDQLRHGIRYIANTLSGVNDIDSTRNKGFIKRKRVDMTLNELQIMQLHNYASRFSDYQKDSQNLFAEMVDMCKEYGCRVIVSVLPVTDSVIWRYSDWDKCFEWIKDFCDDNNIEYYDFNLIKTRNELFSDHQSFYDETHLNEFGANVFTNLFADTLLKYDETGNVNELFYDNYSDLYLNMPYAIYYNNQMNGD